MVVPQFNFGELFNRSYEQARQRAQDRRQFDANHELAQALNKARVANLGAQTDRLRTMLEFEQEQARLANEAQRLENKYSSETLPYRINRAGLEEDAQRIQNDTAEEELTFLRETLPSRISAENLQDDVLEGQMALMADQGYGARRNADANYLRAQKYGQHIDAQVEDLQTKQMGEQMYMLGTSLLSNVNLGEVPPQLSGEDLWRGQTQTEGGQTVEFGAKDLMAAEEQWANDVASFEQAAGLLPLLPSEMRGVYLERLTGAAQCLNQRGQLLSAPIEGYNQRLRQEVGRLYEAEDTSGGIAPFGSKALAERQREKLKGRPALGDVAESLTERLERLRQMQSHVNELAPLYNAQLGRGQGLGALLQQGLRSRLGENPAEAIREMDLDELGEVRRMVEQIRQLNQ